MTTARVGVDIGARDNTSGAFLSAISNINKLNTATQRFGDRQRNMAFQMNDVFTQLTTGTNPMTVMLQQGPQIAQIYGFGNGGVAAAFRDVGNMLWTITKRVGPFALVAGAAAAALTYEVNRVSGETYTMGEVFSATMTVISNSITDSLMPVIKDIEPQTTTVLGSVMTSAKRFGNLLIAVNVAWFEVVRKGLSEIPDLFKYAGAAAAKFFIQQIENMINGVSRLLNIFSAGLNKMFDKLPEDMRPGKIGTIGKWTLPKFDTASLATQLSNPFKGIGADTGKIFATDYIGGFVEKISSQAAKNRLQAAVKESTKPRKNAKGGRGDDDESSRYNQFNHPLYGGDWNDVAEGFADITPEVDKLGDAMRGVGDMFDGWIDDAIVGGFKFKNILSDIGNLGKSMISSSLKGLFKTLLFGTENQMYGGLSGGLLSGIVGSLFGGLPSFDVGTDYVPHDMIAKVHKGEKIIPADQASRMGNGGTSVTIIDQRSNGAAVQPQQQPDGSMLIVLRDMARQEAHGAIKEAMPNYGLKPKNKMR